jgi:hypothetical protein
MTSRRNTTTTITVVSVFLLTTHHLTCRPSGHPAQRTGHPAGYFGPGCTFYALASFRAAAAGQRLDPLDLFARLLIDSGVAKVDVPVEARVRVVLVFSGWVCGTCARLIHVNLLVRLAGSRGVPSTCGTIYVV